MTSERQCFVFLIVEGYAVVLCAVSIAQYVFLRFTLRFLNQRALRAISLIRKYTRLIAAAASEHEANERGSSLIGIRLHL